MSNTAFVVAAFSVTWLAFIGYLIHLRREVARAREALQRTTGAGAR